MHPNVHWNTIYNNQDKETTWMFINRGMDKEGVVHIYNGILFCHENEQNNTFAEMWIDLEIVKLSEVRQTEKEKYHMILLISGI